MSVRSVLTQANIHDNIDFRVALPDIANRTLGDSIHRISLTALGILLNRNAKKHNAADTRLFYLIKNLMQTVNRILKNTRHGLHRIPDVLPLHYKYGVNKILRMQSCLLHHGTDSPVPA